MTTEIKLNRIETVNDYTYIPGMYVDMGDEIEWSEDGVLKRGEVTEPLGHSVEVSVY